MQRRKYCVNIPMDVFSNINTLIVQLGTSCAFDSPGLARNEPTSGNQTKLHLPTLTFKEELQYTHYTLCFYEKNMYICTKQFIKV
ncbi:hypothetical protein KZO74_06665 [Prevotella salivae]|uniref:hypothetical protein n=1 Tax=Segatella salivae TaxID=228604 RepID=UPI001C5F65B0|nr:hypothetical protein [Segatella salivae]MBW4764678.1 hypothetical protein [Segatella salivae]